MPSVTDTTPWIRIDMLSIYTILGLYLRKYNNNYHCTLYQVKTSVDWNTHHYVGQNIVPDFVTNEDYTTDWFDNATDSRYWTIEPVYGKYVIRKNTPFV